MQVDAGFAGVPVAGAQISSVHPALVSTRVVVKASARAVSKATGLARGDGANIPDSLCPMHVCVFKNDECILGADTCQTTARHLRNLAGCQDQSQPGDDLHEATPQCQTTVVWAK